MGEEDINEEGERELERESGGRVIVFYVNIVMNYQKLFYLKNRYISYIYCDWYFDRFFFLKEKEYINEN